MLIITFAVKFSVGGVIGIKARIVTLLNKYLKSPGFRLKISLIRTVLSTVVYSIANLIFAIYYNSPWFFTVFSYYGSVAFARISLLRARSFDKKEQRNSVLRLGRVMLLINICMSIMMLYTVINNRVKAHSVFMVSLLGIYSFSVIVFNISSFIYSRKKRPEPVRLAYRTVCLTASLTSFFNFQNSLTFTLDITSGLRLFLNLITAIFCTVFVLVVSVFMIVRGRAEKDIANT